MGFHERAADRQPDSGAAAVAIARAVDPVEPVEDVLQVLGGYPPLAGVGDGELDGVRCALGSAESDRAAGWGCASRR